MSTPGAVALVAALVANMGPTNLAFAYSTLLSIHVKVGPLLVCTAQLARRDTEHVPPLTCALGIRVLDRTLPPLARFACVVVAGVLGLQTGQACLLRLWLRFHGIWHLTVTFHGLPACAAYTGAR
jgi:hypothetical protein